MKLRWDPEADALYVALLEDGAPPSRTEQIDSGTLVDLDRLGHILGIEVLRPARTWPLDEIIAQFGMDPDQAAALRALFSGSHQDRRYPFARSEGDQVAVA